MLEKYLLKIQFNRKLINLYCEKTFFQIRGRDHFKNLFKQWKVEFLKQIIKFQLVNGSFKSTQIGTIQNVNWNK